MKSSYPVVPVDPRRSVPPAARLDFGRGAQSWSPTGLCSAMRRPFERRRGAYESVGWPFCETGIGGRRARNTSSGRKAPERLASASALSMSASVDGRGGDALGRPGRRGAGTACTGVGATTTGRRRSTTAGPSWRPDARRAAAVVAAAAVAAAPLPRAPLRPRSVRRVAGGASHRRRTPAPPPTSMGPTRARAHRGPRARAPFAGKDG